MEKILFQFEDKSLTSRTLEGNFKGLTILEVAEDNDIHINHNCGEVCACSTCHVYVESGDDTLREISDKEEDFIDRATNPRLESRLSCQCEILKEGANLIVTVPDQSGIIGHEH